MDKVFSVEEKLKAMTRPDFEQQIALFALRCAKDIIQFQHDHICILSHRPMPPPPIDTVDDAIMTIKTGKLPWEDR
jgi:hypothetical protein